jgi:hypothetical protein
MVLDDPGILLKAPSSASARCVVAATPILVVIF